MLLISGLKHDFGIARSLRNLLDYVKLQFKNEPEDSSTDLNPWQNKATPGDDAIKYDTTQSPPIAQPSTKSPATQCLTQESASRVKFILPSSGDTPVKSIKKLSQTLLCGSPCPTSLASLQHKPPQSIPEDDSTTDEGSTSQDGYSGNLSVLHQKKHETDVQAAIALHAVEITRKHLRAAVNAQQRQAIMGDLCERTDKLEVQLEHLNNLNAQIAHLDTLRQVELERKAELNRQKAARVKGMSAYQYRREQRRIKNEKKLSCRHDSGMCFEQRGECPSCREDVMVAVCEDCGYQACWAHMIESDKHRAGAEPEWEDVVSSSIASPVVDEYIEVVDEDEVDDDCGVRLPNESDTDGSLDPPATKSKTSCLSSAIREWKDGLTTEHIYAPQLEARCIQATHQWMQTLDTILCHECNTHHDHGGYRCLKCTRTLCTSCKILKGSHSKLTD